MPEHNHSPMHAKVLVGVKACHCHSLAHYCGLALTGTHWHSLALTGTHWHSLASAPIHRRHMHNIARTILGPQTCLWPVPPEGALGYCTCAQVAGSTKRRKKIGSSVAYKTTGTFLSQE